MMECKQTQDDLRVVIASYDASWLRVAGNYLFEQAEITNVDCYARGKLLLEALKEGVNAQILVLDEQLQDMDLLDFMQAYAALHLKNKPIVIGLCSKQYLGYTGNLIFLGMTDFMAKPIHMQPLYGRLLRLHHEHDSGVVRAYCEGFYHAWGIPCGESTLYLTDAVCFANDAVEKLAVRKELLWSVAMLHGISKAAVDSSLRRLIEKIEKKATPEYLAFKAQVGCVDKSISVGVLIYAMKDAFRQHTAQQEATGQSVFIK